MHGLKIAFFIVIGIATLVWLEIILFIAYDILCDFKDSIRERKRRGAK